MKPSLAQKIVNATLLLAPIVGALIASAAVRAAEAVPTVTITTMDAGATEAGHAAILLASRDGASFAQPLVVPIKLGGTATPGADYVSPGTSITFPAQTPMVMVKIALNPSQDLSTPTARGFSREGAVPSPGAHTVSADRWGAVIIGTGSFTCQWALSGSARDMCQHAMRTKAYGRQRLRAEALSRRAAQKQAAGGGPRR